MYHFARNSSISIPLSMLLYDGIVGLNAAQASILCNVICLDNGYIYDTADGTFKTSPVNPSISVSCYGAGNWLNGYYARLSIGAWVRGHYQCKFRHTPSGQEFATDFTVGLYMRRALGHSAVYSGTVLTLSAWVEEEGVIQTDYVSLTNCRILDSAGVVIAAGTLADNNTPSGGIFRFAPTVTLTPNTNYIFAATANVAAPATVSAYSFPLRVGLARP